ncbi:uncharacterized protein BX664DRAFT_314908 [Halteromyces radiatus]|uniref:uncharacterized protein n=1 Tax=Halteromyces radiatus TaxID=101107 RepID=UPI0022205044|nr:uncharacterized protein BX664DRAFT_314908 [Halteromyces radiatus]KAI8089732.1 hypothetical protein BX664DRAFT_314908 [Halteromyces radiatus]
MDYNGTFLLGFSNDEMIPTVNMSTSYYGFTKREHDDLDPTPLSSLPSSDMTSTIKTTKKVNHGGRKRTIIFEEADAENQRKNFLKRNRIAALKCREKKKKWIQDLETNYEMLSTQNQHLRSMITVYQKEINTLKSNLLFCNGQSSYMQSYAQHNHHHPIMNPIKTEDQTDTILSLQTSIPLSNSYITIPATTTKSPASSLSSSPSPSLINDNSIISTTFSSFPAYLHD